MTVSILNLMESTEQEVFDHIAVHLLTQNKKSVGSLRTGDRDPPCVYKSPTGLKCAAGCLIPDEAYTPLIESKSWGSLVRSEYAPPKHMHLISRLQQVHDSLNATDWPVILNTIAYSYSLNTEAIDHLMPTETIAI